jgi:hypothetical protein
VRRTSCGIQNNTTTIEASPSPSPSPPPPPRYYGTHTYNIYFKHLETLTSQSMFLAIKG